MKYLKDPLLMAGFVCNLFYSISYPTFHIELMSDMNSNLMSFSSLISCILTIYVSKTWLKSSEKLYSRFNLILLIDTIVYTIMIILYLTNNISSSMYYIVDAILFSTITRNMMCAGTRLKALRYKDDKREEFDNRIVILSNSSSIFGYSFGALFSIDVPTAFILLYVGSLIDNILHFLAYKSTNKNYEKISDKKVDKI